MKQRPLARLAAAVAGGVGLALAAPMLAAVGQVSPPAPVLTIGPTARLVAQGAAVAVPIRVVVICPPGTTARLSVQVVQATGRDVAHALGSKAVECTGTAQDVEVFATSSDFRFSQGEAFVSANLFACGFSGPGPFPSSSCTAQAEREVLIVGDTTGPIGTPPPPTFPPPPPTILPPPPGTPGIPGFSFPDLSALLNLIKLILFGGFGGV